MVRPVGSSERVWFVVSIADQNTTTINISIRVRPRPHNINVWLLHAAPALVGEQYPITIQVKNNDTRIFAIGGDFLLQPTENDSGKRTFQAIFGGLIGFT